MQKKKFSFLELVDILFLFMESGLILAIEFIEVDFDGFVVMASVFRGTEGADEGVLVAFAIEADQIYFLSLVIVLSALDVFDDIAGDLLFH